MGEYYLVHHGILGQKWGVRRFQNEDGTLTSAGRKRYSKEYEKQIKKSNKAYNKVYNKMQLDAYNRAASDMNNGEIERFNERQRKKYGENFASRSGYVSDYEKLFHKFQSKYLEENSKNFLKNNKNYQKAMKMSEKYEMYLWDDLAKKLHGTA